MVQQAPPSFCVGLHHTRAEGGGVPSGCFSRVTLSVKAGEGHGVSTWRIVDLCRIAEERFGVRSREGGMRRLVKALDLSWQKIRPRHPKADKAAQERFKNGGVSPPHWARWPGATPRRRCGSGAWTRP